MPVRFSLGQTVATPGAIAALADDLTEILRRACGQITETAGKLLGNLTLDHL